MYALKVRYNMLQYFVSCSTQTYPQMKRVELVAEGIVSFSINISEICMTHGNHSFSRYCFRIKSVFLSSYCLCICICLPACYYYFCCCYCYGYHHHDHL